ncbi:TraX family protein [Pseudoxanthomonas sp.]|uniref:TraX family protein n=1 Tax=Pseudoxanthomonas sp. TaxID=1871049 RepID=UPI00258C0E9D|nr:TraX family protein [Pseudoxanthomonas sp.]MCR6687083.1 TraX family protein [Pseudoxanthomonas sp.]
MLKWIALVLMTGDHVHKVLLHGAAPWLEDAGRIVFPIFAFVLGSNLWQASPGATDRALRRLVVAGVLIQPLHALVFGAWLPLNILLTLAAGVYVASTQSLWRAVLCLLVGSFFLDYQWAGVGFVLACAMFQRWHGWRACLALACGMFGLCWFNGNAWALLALPLLWCFRSLRGDVPRGRWTFLGYYAAHLAVLAGFASILGESMQ